MKKTFSLLKLRERERESAREISKLARFCCVCEWRFLKIQLRAEPTNWILLAWILKRWSAWRHKRQMEASLKVPIDHLTRPIRYIVSMCISWVRFKIAFVNTHSLTHSYGLVRSNGRRNNEFSCKTLNPSLWVTNERASEKWMMMMMMIKYLLPNFQQFACLLAIICAID